MDIAELTVFSMATLFPLDVIMEIVGNQFAGRISQHSIFIERQSLIFMLPPI